MFLVRDVMYCKPGKTRPMVDKFLALAKLSEKAGMGKMRVLTDVSAESYWMVVSEREVPNLEEFSGKVNEAMNDPALQAIMKGYHDLVDRCRREIYTIEG
jgi:hypothetical protein